MTYALGTKSRDKLKGVHPHLVAIVERAIELTSQDFAVHDGLRTIDQQRELVRRGASKTMNSKHLPQADGLGHAVDLVPFVNGQLRWEWGAIYPIASAVQTAAIALGHDLIWGGVWDRELHQLEHGPDGMKKAVEAYCVRHPGPDFIDGPHWQLA